MDMDIKTAAGSNLYFQAPREGLPEAPPPQQSPESDRFTIDIVQESLRFQDWQFPLFPHEQRCLNTGWVQFWSFHNPKRCRKQEGSILTTFTDQNGPGARKECYFLLIHLPKRPRSTRVVLFLVLSLAKTAPEHERGAIFSVFTCQNGPGA